MISVSLNVYAELPLFMLDLIAGIVRSEEPLLTILFDRRSAFRSYSAYFSI